MLISYANTRGGKSYGEEGGKRNSGLFETLDEIWKLNHCYARIRIISAYCMFLLKRANHYRADINRISTVEFVHEQFREMVQYKARIVEIEKQAFEEPMRAKSHVREEI